MPNKTVPRCNQLEADNKAYAAKAQAEVDALLAAGKIMKGNSFSPSDMDSLGKAKKIIDSSLDKGAISEAETPKLRAASAAIARAVEPTKPNEKDFSKLPGAAEAVMQFAKANKQTAEVVASGHDATLVACKSKGR